uniref:Uncharacterized protein n=1 Tax=Arundo donax TaxID=35708 RepID=A0A0A8XQ63_ARUDO
MARQRVRVWEGNCGVRPLGRWIWAARVRDARRRVGIGWRGTAMELLLVGARRAGTEVGMG